MCSLSEVCSRSRINVPSLNKGRKVDYAWLDYKGNPLQLSLKGLKVPFPPSVYNGTRRESKKNLCFNLNDSTYEELEALEKKLSKKPLRI